MKEVVQAGDISGTSLCFAVCRESTSDCTVHLLACPSYLEFLRSLEKRVDEDWPSVAQSLEDIRTALLSSKDAIVNLTSSEKIMTAADQHVSALLGSLPETSGLTASPWIASLSGNNEGLVIPTQVIIEKLCIIVEFKLSDLLLV